MESIYQRLGEPLDPATRDLVAAGHAESRNSEARPAHRYALADFGLTDAEVDEAFGEYVGEYLDGRG